MAKLSEFVKCRYSHCKHADEPLRREDAIKIGSVYYHRDCFEEKTNIHNIEKYYIDNFDSQPIIAFLRKTINSIVFTKNIETSFLLFCLQYAKKNHISLRSPAGMFYLVKNAEIIKAWEEQKRRGSANKLKQTDFNIEEEYSQVDGYSNVGKTAGFGRVIR